MDLRVTQLILSRLYTDAALRRRFLANPQAFGKEFGLDEKQIMEFSRISGWELTFFADSLIRKRCEEVRKLLPLTAQAFGARFGGLFREFAKDHQLAMPQPHRKDAIAFCRFLKESLRRELPDGPWVLDLSVFEEACLEATEPARRWTIRLFRYPIRELVPRLSTKESPLLPVRRFSLAVWFRLSRQGRLRFYTLQLPRLPRFERATY